MPLGPLSKMLGKAAKLEEPVDVARRSLFGLKPELTLPAELGAGAGRLPAVLPDASMAEVAARYGLPTAQPAGAQLGDMTVSEVATGIANKVLGSPTRRGFLKQAGSAALRHAVPMPQGLPAATQAEQKALDVATEVLAQPTAAGVEAYLPALLAEYARLTGKPAPKATVLGKRVPWHMSVDDSARNLLPEDAAREAAQRAKFKAGPLYAAHQQALKAAGLTDDVFNIGDFRTVADLAHNPGFTEDGYGVAIPNIETIEDATRAIGSSLDDFLANRAGLAAPRLTPEQTLRIVRDLNPKFDAKNKRVYKHMQEYIDSTVEAPSTAGHAANGVRHE